MNESVSTYRVRSPETWDQARDAYLAGDTADSVCRRFGLGLSALRRRARLEGWRRGDQADPEPYDPEADLDGIEDVDLSRMALAARRRLQLAVMAGEAGDASRWLKLFETLSAMAAHAAEPDELHELHPVFSVPRSESMPALDSEAVSESEHAFESDELHQLHPDFSRAAPPPAVVAVLNRAKRRRRRRAERLRRSSA